MHSITFNDQNRIPQLGFGVWQVANAEADNVVSAAIETGYRSIDTASIYNNEEGVGKGIKSSGIPRSDIFITTKLWSTDQGTDSVIKAMETSLKRLGLDYVDLYLIHWPSPKRNRYVDSWKSLIQIKNAGLAKSIGVCNFQVPHLEKIINETGIVPVINQIELHPKFQQKDLKAFHKKHNIVTEAWSPLGQATFFNNKTLLDLSQRYQKSPAQIILKWHIQESHVAIPKTTHISRMKENMDIFDFELTSDDISLITKMDEVNGRVGPNPDQAEF